MRPTPPPAPTPLSRVVEPERFAALRSRVGRTPLLALRCRLRGVERTVYAKAEGENLTGSIKDRSVLDLLLRASIAGELRPGDTIVEAAGVNAGLAYAAIGRSLGHPVRIYMPAWRRTERWLALEEQGADVVAVSREEDGFGGCVECVLRAAEANGGTFFPRGGEGADYAAAHHASTGPELVRQLGLLGLAPTHFVAGVGTGATLTGVGDALRRRIPAVRVHPLEAANAPTLRTGAASGSHRIEGLAEERTDERFDLTRLDRVVGVWDGDAILAAQRLRTELGLAVGVSSGANLLGALELAVESGSRSVVATVFPDSGARGSEILTAAEPERAGYLSPELELLGSDVVGCP